MHVQFVVLASCTLRVCAEDSTLPGFGAARDGALRQSGIRQQRDGAYLAEHRRPRSRHRQLLRLRRGGLAPLAQGAGAFANISGRTVTYSNTPAFSQAHAAASYVAIVYINTMTFTNGGTVTGKRYNVTLNGIVERRAAARAIFPATRRAQRQPADNIASGVYASLRPIAPTFR